MGMMFTLTGTILTALGLATRDNAAVYVKSSGIDINLWWGLALLVFGVVVLALGRRGQMRMEKTETKGIGNRE
jgi:multidrug transporter EmrE-like cation transporter